MTNKTKNNIKSEPLTTGQIAEYCHVTVRAVLKWVAEGKLKAYRTPGKHSRVSMDDFLTFLKKYSMPIPKELELGDVKKKILIVDDDKEMVNSIKRTLNMDKNYSLTVAFDGFSAGQKFCQVGPDLVILDIKMPGLNGYEVCSYIRDVLGNKEVKILAISGIIAVVDAKKILDLGANDYLAKPFDNDELKRKIEKLLNINSEAEDTMRRR